MAETLTVQITAQDGVTKVFKAISNGAQDAGKSVENAGKQGAKGMNELGKSAEDNARRMDRLKAEATAIGAAIGVLGAGIIKAGDAYRDQRLQLEALNRMYGEAADQIIAYSEAIQDTTRYSNDAARQSLAIFGTLNQNYGLSIEQLNQLLSRSADLSTLFGKSLSDTSQMIQNAMRGEAEYIEQVNISLQDNYVASQYAARGLGDWNKVTDDSAKAAFRFQLFMEQSEYAMGAAAAEADRAGGQFRQFLNEMQDAGQAVGGFLGPIGEIAAELAPITIALPVVAAGIGRLSTAVKGSQLGMAALGAAINPVALGLGALAVAGIATWNMFNEGRESAERLEDALIQLGDVAQNLRLGYRDDEARFLDEFGAGIKGIQDEIDNLDRSGLDAIVSQMAAMRGEHPRYIFDEIAEGMSMTTEESDRLTVAIDEVTKAFANSNIDAAALDAEIDKLFAAYKAREITFDEFLAGLEGIVGNLTLFRKEAEGAASSAANFASELDRLRGLTGATAGSASELTTSVNRIDAALQDGSLSAATLNAYMAELDRQMATGAITWAQYQERVAGVDEALLGLNMTFSESLGAGVLGTAVTSLENITTATEDYAAAAEQAEEHTIAFGDALGSGFRASLDETTASITEQKEAWEEFVEYATGAMLELTNNADYLSQVNLTGLATSATTAAEGFKDVATAMDSVLAIFGQIDAMGQRYGQSVSIAEALIGEPGVWAAIDDVLVSGRITLDEYNAAVESGYAIQNRQIEVEENLNAIRTKQLPILEQTSQAYADYIDAIRQMPADEQMSVLGWMDTGLQARVQQFADLGNELRALGPAGSEAMQQVVNGIVKTDPVLTEMLENLGLIEEQANGDYTINMDAVGAMDSIGRLTASIDALTLALGGVPPLHLDVTGADDIDAAVQDIYALNAAAAEGAVIEIATRLKPPERNWAEDGYMGGWGADLPPVEVPTRFQIPDDIDWSGLDIPAMPVDADTGPAAITLESFEPPAITVPVAFTSALGGGLLGAAQDAAGALNIPEIVVPAPDTSEANAAIDGVEANLADLDGNTAMTYINVLDSASATILDVGSLIAGLDSATATVSINANAANAYAEIANMQAYNGSVLATTYVNIVTRAVGSSLSSQRHGGIPGYAGGGVLFEGGEAGAELAYFAGGGVALLPTHGLYSAPSGTYISPANANSGITYGGTTVNVTVQGNVYGIDDLTTQVAAQMAPALAEVATTHYREQGTW